MQVGDKVLVGPFEIRQFRDTHMPGPQDHGDTAMLSRHESVGAISADLSLLIPFSPELPKVAAWLAEQSAEQLRAYALIAATHYARRVGTAADDGLDQDRLRAANDLIETLTPEAGDAGAGT